MLIPRTYTPEQVAEILQLSKNTIYDLISRGEIVAKRIGKVYRISAKEISFAYSGLDEDLYQAEKEDFRSLPRVTKEIKTVRKSL